METKEAQENINKILEEEKPEKLLPKFEKAEEACYKGSEQGLKNLVYFASEIVWYYWDKKQMDSVVEIYVKVRKVIDYLIGINFSRIL